MDNQELLQAISDLLDEKLDARIGSRFEEIDARFDRMEKRLDGIDARLDGIDARLDGIDARLDGIDARLDGIDDRLDRIEERQDRMEERQDRMELRLEKVESVVSALQHGQMEMHKELKNLSARVESTYMLALEAWGNSMENRSLLKASH